MFPIQGDNPDADEVEEFHWDEKYGKGFRSKAEHAATLILNLSNNSYLVLATARKISSHLSVVVRDVLPIRPDSKYRPIVKLGNKVVN